MLFKFKVVAPKDEKTDWVEAEGADFDDALENWHFNCFGIGLGVRVYVPIPEGYRCDFFITVEDEKGIRTISRIIYVEGAFIWRTPKNRIPELHEVARILGTKVEVLESYYNEECQLNGYKLSRI